MNEACGFAAITVTGRARGFSMSTNDMMKVLGPKGVAFLENRGLDPKTSASYGLYTGRSLAGGKVVPDRDGDVIVVPYFEGGVVVAEKYRAPNKWFWQRPNGRRTFWNSDVLDDPALQDGTDALIITEGEPDALAAICCGYRFAVSVPDGAPPPGSPKAIDPADEATGKFAFIWNNRDRLKRIKRFMLAVDNDEAGEHLRQGLLHRLSAARCAFVEYPEGCKDLNDVLVRYGAEGVRDVLNGAKPFPVHGIYRLLDYPPAAKLTTFSTGWNVIDPYLRLFPGEFMVVTGIPGMGKSTWLLNLLVNLRRLHEWRSVLFSPEMPVVPHLRDLLRLIIGGDTDPDATINDAFVFLDVDPTGRNDDADFNLGWIIDKAIDAVFRYDVRVLLIDPWNEVEHAKRRDESTTEYIARSIRELRRFAREYGVVIIVVAHPTKDVHEKGEVRIPTLYDIDGSAAWFNKSDHGLCIHRRDPYRNESSLLIQKVRFPYTGEKGEVCMSFDRVTRRYAASNVQEEAA
jgi:twinkle protein